MFSDHNVPCHERRTRMKKGLIRQNKDQQDKKKISTIKKRTVKVKNGLTR